jgi:ankyrin repeat protein
MTFEKIPAISREVVAYPTLLKALIARGADVNLSSTYAESPLGIAAGTANIESARLLLASGANPDSTGGLMSSPLSKIITYPDNRGVSRSSIREFCALLLSSGANPNGNAKFGRMLSTECLPIYVAVAKKDHAIVRMLAEAGADVDREATLHRPHRSTDQHVTAFREAIRSGDVEMMLTLLKVGASDALLAGDTSGGMTPFLSCVLSGRDLLVDYYVRERGESLDQCLDGKGLEEAAPFSKTKQLLRSLRTELVVQKALDGPNIGSEVTCKLIKAKGLSPL